MGAWVIKMKVVHVWGMCDDVDRLHVKINSIVKMSYITKLSRIGGLTIN
jgi:hypothetical protein